ncbi:hypothetical protein JCM10213_001012 [Rhodosporidiobolus nylandii]
MAATARPPPPIDVEASLLSRKMRSLSTHDMQLPPTPTSAIAPPPIPTLTAPQRFPLYLPSCPPHIYKPRSQSLELLVGDEDLRDVPQAFLRDMLAHLAPRLLAGCNAIEPILPHSSFGTQASLPPTLPFRCHPSAAGSESIPPTHFLACTFLPPSTGAPIAQRLLVPIHDVPWSLACAALAPLLAAARAPPSPPLAAAPEGSIFASSSSSARPPPQIAAMYIRGLPEMSQFVSARADLVDWRAQPGTLPAFAAAAAAKESLPVVALSLPDREAFELMHGWVYGTLAKSEIWEELVYGSGAASSDGEDDNDDEMSDEEDLDVGTRLAKIAALWRTAVALECADEELWEAMGKAWETVVEEVLCGERRNETDEEDEASEDEEMEEGEEGEGGAFSP